MKNFFWKKNIHFFLKRNYYKANKKGGKLYIYIKNINYV